MLIKLGREDIHGTFDICTQAFSLVSVRLGKYHCTPISSLSSMNPENESIFHVHFASFDGKWLELLLLWLIHSHVFYTFNN